jgi:hypothetical protein
MPCHAMGMSTVASARASEQTMANGWDGTWHTPRALSGPSAHAPLPPPSLAPSPWVVGEAPDLTIRLGRHESSAARGWAGFAKERRGEEREGEERRGAEKVVLQSRHEKKR